LRGPEDWAHSVGVRSPILLAIVAAVLFGAATPAGKLLLREAPPVLLAALLYAGAALGALPAVWRRGARRRRQTPPRRDFLRLFAAVALGGVLGPILILFGLRLASATSVSLWLNLELVATAVLGQLFFHDYLGRRGFLGVAGVLVASLILSAGEGGSAGFLPGILVATGCLCWGLDNHLTAIVGGFTPAEMTFFKGVGAAGCNLVLAAVTGVPIPVLGTIAGGLLAGALCYGLSITFYITAARGLGATRAQVFFASSPFFGAILSRIALGEAAGARHAVAGALMLASAGLILWDRSAHEHEHLHGSVEHEHDHTHDDGHHDHVHASESLDPGDSPCPEPAGRRHSHPHRHESVQHSHPHWPDLHHRHPHGD
jgi:drug/metabolite transporter (DMT)-like permease